jgi:sterol 14-demethylase
VLGEDLTSLDFDAVKEFKTLEHCVEETLRLHPPLFTIMRKVLKDQSFKNYTIPAGHYICVSPAIAHRLPEVFDQPDEFNPNRFLDIKNQEADDGKAHRFAFFPFGAGRNRCIGEQFGLLQIKTIWSTIIRLFDIEADGPMPESDYTSLVVNPASACIRYKRRIPMATSS